jgi:hypothetical protein
MSGMIPATKQEINERRKRQKQMQRLQQKALRKAVAAAREKSKDGWVMVEPASAIDMIKDSIKRKGGRKRRRRKKTRRKRKTKRKRRRTKRR